MNIKGKSLIMTINHTLTKSQVQWQQLKPQLRQGEHDNIHDVISQKDGGDGAGRSYQTANSNW